MTWRSEGRRIGWIIYVTIYFVKKKKKKKRKERKEKEKKFWEIEIRF